MSPRIFKSPLCLMLAILACSTLGCGGLQDEGAANPNEPNPPSPAVSQEAGSAAESSQKNVAAEDLTQKKTTKSPQEESAPDSTSQNTVTKMPHDSDLEWKYKEFWYVEEGDQLRSVTDEEVAAAEKYWKVKLPPEFVRLAKISDGGIPWLCKFTLQDEEYRLNDFYSIAPRKVGGCIIPPPEYDTDADNVPERVLVFSSEGHSWWGLDYRNSDVEPSVLHYDSFEDEFITVTPSFREFFAGLEED